MNTMSASVMESNETLIRIIHGICARYGLDYKAETTLYNIKAFLKPIDGDAIYRKYGDIGQAIDAIITMYGEKSNYAVSIPDSLNQTHNSLLHLIRTPGDDAIPASSISANFTSNNASSDNNRVTNDTSGNGSFLDLDITRRIETVKYMNYSSLFRDEYVIIDSRYQNLTNTDRSKLVFNLITNTKARSEHGGIIIGAIIKNIVEIKVSAFTIPYKPIFSNFYNKITLTINEWVSNSYEAYEGGQFHFIFSIDRIDNNLIYLVPDDPIYSFSRPMNYIDNFTLSFGSMLPKITLDPDRAYVNTFDYTSSSGILTFASPHNLITGDLIYITNFTTPEPARDIVIVEEMNRPEGHIITKKDANSIVINVNLSLIRRADPIGSSNYPIDTFEQQALVYFASKRITIPFRFRYLTDYTTRG